MHFGISKVLDTNDPLRRLLAAAAVLSALLSAGEARGDCVPLPSTQLWSLDRIADGDPERGVAEAQKQIRNFPAQPDPLVEAGLYAIIAAARAQQGRSAEAHTAVLAARHLLDALPDSAETQRLRDRLVISDIQTAETEADLRSAIRSLNMVIANDAPRSIEQLCALAVRADIHAENSELDLGAADGLAAYSQAEDAGLAEPRIQAAGSLVNIYRRSGLLSEAQRLNDEMIKYERTMSRTSQLATALYVQGQLLIQSQKYDEASQILESSRRMALQVGDRFGASFTNVALCPALISAGDLASAERVCSASDSDFAAANRQDLLTLMLAYRARLDLARGRPDAALAKLQEVLGPRAGDVIPSEAPKVHTDYARALGAAGRFDAAYAELSRALELRQSLDIAARSRAAAVLKVTADADRQIAERTTITQRLWIALATAATLFNVLLGCLLWVSWRHKHQARRQERELLEVVASERMRLSSDMHEGLGQELAGISLLLKSIADGVDRGKPAANEELREIIGKVCHAVEMTREIAHGLSPIPTHGGSLSTALQRLALESSRRLHLPVTMEEGCYEGEVNGEVADHLFRIVQEAITNAAKHSGCSRIDISFRLVGNRLNLTVSDNGLGFCIRASGPNGLGVKMMSYRARLMGGTIEFEPPSGGGTRLVVSVPMITVPDA